MNSARIQDYKICTLASHSALQILKGARDEGIRNIAVCERRHLKTYKAFPVADEIIEVDSFAELVGLDQRLAAENAVLIPHGSLINALSLEQIDALTVNFYGNKHVLGWESDRTKQRDWLKGAGLITPKVFESPEEIAGPVIIKFFGPSGGKGYFLAHTPDEFREKIQQHPDKRYVIQEYIIGAPIYIHYFQSSLTGELEIMSFDRRYESNVDSIGRISAKDQLDLNIETSYNITGNLPLVVRESLLSTIIEMGEKVVAKSKELDGVGLFGPFCLETVITPDLEFKVFEISARIVAGTNPFINGSPYTDLRYNEPMSTGRRIAREIKKAIESDRLREVLA
jgi:5-formaminoimidazole-4-carboxamide-1-(beta)-D-ribofuranosyl 5'-monophosphate synthetase